jgi:hypothetical protein
MIIKINILKSYGDIFKEKARRLLKDILLLLIIIILDLFVRWMTRGKTFTLFNLTYRIDILLIYLLGFVFIITTSVMFIDIRNLMNHLSSFVITRFPRMKGEFTPGKMILRDLVQIVILFLAFYPLSDIDLTFMGFRMNYLLSFAFIVFSLLFLYDVLINIVKIINTSIQKVIRLLSRPQNEH